MLGISPIEYRLMLPMVELTIFALGILLIDLMIPREWKWLNAVGAFGGVMFATLCVWQIQRQLPRGAAGFFNSLLVDRFAIYFWYLFLASAAITILVSVRYLEIEDEHHGEYYALLLMSVIGMMCMAAGIDIVLIFIGLELMAISIYVLVGFLRRDRRSNEAALKYLLFGAFSSGIFRLRLIAALRAFGQHELVASHREAVRPCRCSQNRPRSAQSAARHRAADHRGRTVVQDRRRFPSISGRPTPTKARPPASPDSCRSR